MGADLRLSMRRALVLLVNIASGVLTLLTGLRENPIIVLVTGRYDDIRARLRERRINYRLLRDDLVDVDTLTNLTRVADEFRFFSAPTRSPENLGEDRSTCMRVNSINVTHAAVYFDDFWGRGARRSQFYFHSISAPRCDIVNFTPEWFDECVTTNGNSTDHCHRYILDHYDDLKNDRVVQIGVPGDFGRPGVPFLRCVGRPDSSFTYITDLLVHQSFWAGGSYHIEFQTSRCRAVPRLINSDRYYGLFQTEAIDQQAEVKVAIDNTGWFALIVTYAYGIVTLILIARGIFNTICQIRIVLYVPSKLRFAGLRRYLRYIVPFMGVSTLSADDETVVIPFKGKVVMASDVWINHWLYITLSVLDALVSVRMTYSVYEMGTWMLSMHVNADNFIFMASALTRLTWLMCFIHTVLRLLFKMAIRSLKELKIIRAELRCTLEWYIDASALFVSYKVYSLMLCLLLYMFLKLHGGTSFMVNAPQASRGIFGGAPEISGFWQNEIMCDFTVIMCFLTLAGGLFGSLMLATRYKYAAGNSLLLQIQRRYIFVGWDVMTTIEALGIDPFNDELVRDGIAATNCSLGCVIQQMYQSGPSGHFALATDSIFYGNGFSAGPVVLRYPRKRAIAMGLLRSEFRTAISSKASKVSSKYAKYAVGGGDASAKSAVMDDGGAPGDELPSAENKSLFDKDLTLVSETTYGRVVLVDEDAPGKYTKNESGLLEYAVTDALSTMNILDVKHLLSNTKSLNIR